MVSEARGGWGPGAVTLGIRDADASLAFYADLLGLSATEGDGGTWRVGAGEDGGPLLMLEHRPDAPPRPARAAGLFHVAFLVPSREDLAAVFLRLRSAGPALAGGSLQGASDHGVSRALYLADPEGNGLEIYHDRPRDAWPRHGGRLAMFTRPLDLPALLDGVAHEAPLPPGTSIGHVHLRTADLDAAEAFWRRETGMETTVRDYPGALFLAHGAYHHHLGLNVWGGPFHEAPEDAAGLVRLEWLAEKGDAAAAAAEGDPPRARTVRTPDGVEVVLRSPARPRPA